jgi:hypothetical protein
MTVSLVSLNLTNFNLQIDLKEIDDLDTKGEFQSCSNKLKPVSSNQRKLRSSFFSGVGKGTSKRGDSVAFGSIDSQSHTFDGQKEFESKGFGQ